MRALYGNCGGMTNGIVHAHSDLSARAGLPKAAALQVSYTSASGIL